VDSKEGLVPKDRSRYEKYIDLPVMDHEAGGGNAPEERTLGRRALLRAAVIGAAASALTKRVLKARPASASHRQLIVDEQGSFTVGGRAIQSPGVYDPTKPPLPFTKEGQTFWINAMYVQYQIPPNPRKLPIVMWHGGGLSGRTWETTPDAGRDGFLSIFMRRGYPVYIIDQPGHGRSGFASATRVVGNGVVGNDVLTQNIGLQQSWQRDRLGPDWPEFWPDSQFPREAVFEYFSQSIPGGDVSDDIPTIAAQLFDRIGPAILLTHSASGELGWRTAIKSPNVKAIIALEGTRYLFPSSAVPPTTQGSMLPVVVPPADFQRLTQIPIQVVFGDHIPTTPTTVQLYDLWRLIESQAHTFVEAVNDNGGDASVLSLPSRGLRGNTHFSMQDRNNEAVADLLSEFLASKGLDARP
jgi:pimeloyl-ACP methyl ester carboxylesterase